MNEGVHVLPRRNQSARKAPNVWMWGWGCASPPVKQCSCWFVDDCIRLPSPPRCRR